MTRIIGLTLVLLAARSAAGADRPTDAAGDPIPEGALARLGTVRFRHAGGVEALAYSPDGKLLLSVSDDVSLWDAETGARRLRLPGDDSPCAVAFSRDGKRFAASFSVGRRTGIGVRVWETATGKELHQFTTTGTICALAFAPDGKTLVLNRSRSALLWEPERKTIRILEENVQRGTSLGEVAIYSPDGKVIAISSSERKDPNTPRGAEYLVRLWDAGSGRLLHTLRGLAGPSRALAFSPDSKLLASGGMWDGNSVRLWDVASGKELPALPGRKCDAFALAFSADGKMLRAVDFDGRLRAWELPSGKALDAPKLESPAPGATAIAFSQDGKRLALGSWIGSAGRANTIRVWDLATGKQRPTFPGHRGAVSSLAFAPDGRRLVSGGREGVLLWDIAGRRVLRRLADQTAVEAITFSPDGTLVAAAPEDDSGVIFWEAKTGEERCRLVPKPKERDLDPRLMRGERPIPVAKLLFSVDGRRLAGLGRDIVFLWDVPARGRPAGESIRLEMPEDPDTRSAVQAIGLFGPGTVLTVAHGAEAIRLNTASGKELSRTGRPIDFEKALGIWPKSSLSPDGRLLAVYCGKGGLAVWELATGEEVLRLQREVDYEDRIHSIAFDPTGRLLATGQADGLVRIWAVGSGKELARRKGHLGAVRALEFSPDGCVLASGGDDTTVLLWDLTGIVRAEKGAGKLSAKALEERWRLLAGSDAAAAHRATAELAADPDRALSFLAEQLKAPSLTARDIERLIADLDADTFAVRERASVALKRLGAAAESALKRALERSPSAEVVRRIEELRAALSERTTGVLTGEPVRVVRALRVLEQAGTAQARRLLRELVREGRTQQIRDEARMTLERLARLNP